jgi:translation initiation factor IF-3
VYGGLPIGRRQKRPQKFEPRTRINFQIRVSEVRVIDSNGAQLGVLSTRDAIKAAQDQGLDLVEVAPTETPPVCRILDFGKYLYMEKKKKRESKKKQVKVEIKECKFRPKIGDHDFYVRIRRAVKFLAAGDKVKVTVMFRGREHAHPELAEKLIARVFEDLKDLGKIEAAPKKEGRDMHALIAPLPEAIRKKAMKIRLEKEKKEKLLKEEKEKESGKGKKKLPEEEDDHDEDVDDEVDDDELDEEEEEEEKEDDGYDDNEMGEEYDMRE